MQRVVAMIFCTFAAGYCTAVGLDSTLDGDVGWAALLFAFAAADGWIVSNHYRWLKSKLL